MSLPVSNQTPVFSVEPETSRSEPIFQQVQDSIKTSDFPPLSVAELNLEMDHAIKNFNFDKVQELLEAGADSNYCVQVGPSTISKALSTLFASDVENHSEEIEFAIKGLFYNIFVDPSVDIDLEPQKVVDYEDIDSLKVFLPAAFFSVCFGQEGLTELFLQKGAYVNSIEGFQDILGLQEADKSDFRYEFVENFSGFLSALSRFNKYSAIDQLMKLGLLNFKDLDNELLLQEAVMDGDQNILNLLDKEVGLQEIFDQNPGFIENCFDLAIEKNQLEAFQAIEKYMPEQLFTEALYPEDILAFTDLKFINYLKEKGVDFSPATLFEIENLLELIAEKNPSKDVLEFVLEVFKTLVNQDKIQLIENNIEQLNKKGISQSEALENLDHSVEILAQENPSIEALKFVLKRLEFDKNLDALMFVANEANLEVLAKMGRPIDIFDDKGETPLSKRLIFNLSTYFDITDPKTYAMSPKFLEALKLVELGADIHVEKDGQNLIERVLETPFLESSATQDYQHTFLENKKITLQTLVDLGVETDKLSEKQALKLASYLANVEGKTTDEKSEDLEHITLKA